MSRQPLERGDGQFAMLLVELPELPVQFPEWHLRAQELQPGFFGRLDLVDNISQNPAQTEAALAS